MPRAPFEAVINAAGIRVTWSRSRSCPCTFAGGGPQGRLPMPGSADPMCLQCNGLGVYWDSPSDPFYIGLSYSHVAVTSDEPGVVQNEDYGMYVAQEPTLTIPYADAAGNVNQAWINATVNDMFVAVDSSVRLTAVLQQGGVTALPLQQNLSVPGTGSVTVYDPVSHTVNQVSGYTVSGTSVFLPSNQYADGQNYMVEFYSSPAYVMFRRSGGMAHDRQFGGGAVNLPVRARAQTLDYWTRTKLGGAVPNYYPRDFSNG